MRGGTSTDNMVLGLAQQRIAPFVYSRSAFAECGRPRQGSVHDSRLRLPTLIAVIPCKALNAVRIPSHISGTSHLLRVSLQKKIIEKFNMLCLCSTPHSHTRPLPYLTPYLTLFSCQADRIHPFPSAGSQLRYLTVHVPCGRPSCNLSMGPTLTCCGPYYLASTVASGHLHSPADLLPSSCSWERFPKPLVCSFMRWFSQCRLQLYTFFNASPGKRYTKAHIII